MVHFSQTGSGAQRTDHRAPVRPNNNNNRWPNTMQAHRLMLLAQAQGKADQLSEALFVEQYVVINRCAINATLFQHPCGHPPFTTGHASFVAFTIGMSEAATSACWKR